ncbi:MAG: RnfABCDGE type electron transport complex subunit G [Burkholderiales bacterium]|nr:RnfABCDGE type electron transport complex subunit G [Burkholderiales bacterium]MCP5293083.1 RnfABCDGE type electron transport complex subunit G [Burkholderiales bacterium]
MQAKHLSALSVNSLKMLRAMVSIGLICALIIVLTYQGTQSRIARLKAEALEKAIFRVIPEMITKKIFQIDLNGQLVETTAETSGVTRIYAGYDENGKLAGIAVEASGIGFAGALRVLYGYDPGKQVITGLHVLESKETPGLGDKIEKDADFLANFAALDVSLNDDFSTPRNTITTVKAGHKKNPWEVDGITGATISSRAIGHILAASTRQMVPLIFKNKSILEKSGTTAYVNPD